VTHVLHFRNSTRVRPARRFLGASLMAGMFLLPLSALAQYSPCDLNQDGAVNSTDVTLAVNMVLGLSGCSANITGTGGCNAVMVQRVVAASLPGGTCHPTILNWTASTSPNVLGYNVYRSTTSGGSYTILNSSLITTGTTYTDATSQPGHTYYYVGTTVDVSGNESAYSSPPVAAVVPTP
jgi:fibronectin type 3 domain-containing protein